ncbi:MULTISPECIES: hypothetical protein [unclassified Streptomyces]|uniref:Serine/arginine repetitive matrix protein 2 n=1 Tax=Streptomyces sp. NBC_00060 TaxID=2975636 RepID=A0AAU2GZK0_9ACTN
MSARRGGGAHWNDETQSWEQGGPPPRRGAGSAPRPPDPPAAPPSSPPMFGAPGSPQPPPPEPPGSAPAWLSPGSGPSPGAYHEAETQGAYELPRDPAHPPPYAPLDPGRRRQRAIVAAVAAAVLAGGLAGGWLMWGRDDGSGSGGVAGASSSASAGTDPSGTPTDSPTDTPTDTATDTPTDSASPGTGAAAVPDGFRQVEDPLGWSVAVPATWTRTEERGSALYRSPDERYLLQMFRLTEPGITPYEALRITSDNLAAQRGYQQISLRRMAEVTTTDAAELVYAYNRTVQTDRIQGIARSFVAGNGVPYTVLVYGPDEDWPAQLGVLNAVLGTFTPD